MAATAVPNSNALSRNTPGAAFSDIVADSATIKGSSRNKVPPITSLHELGIDETLARNVSEVIRTLTPVQRYTMPVLVRDMNVLSCSYTGSGKTAAFLVPILNNVIRIIDDKGMFKPGVPAQPLALVVVPTRELAIQIKEEAVSFSRNTPLANSIHLVCGGKNMELERKRLANLHCNVVIATVGRLMDILEQELIALGEVKYFILDEADVMMTKDFFTEVINLGKICNENCVSAMFSATYPNAVRKAAESLLGSSFVEILVGEDGPTASKTITQEFQLVERCEKNFILKNTLESRLKTEKILVFGSTIDEAERIFEFLVDSSFTAGILHSGLESQRQREFALNEFRRKAVTILVATSVAARGLDIPNVDLVINYDLPNDIEEYILRIGRTGRVGNAGQSLSFVEMERDGPMADKLISSLKRADQIVPGWLYDLKTKFEEDELRICETHDLGELSNKKRIFNAYGSSVVGIPICSEIEDDTWD